MRQCLISLLAVALLCSFNPVLAQNIRFGTNVSPPLYYSTDGLYVDILTHANGWSNSTSQPSQTTNGYPLSTAQSLLWTNGYPSGIYNFYGEGTFSLSFTGSGVNYAPWPNMGWVPGTLKKIGNITTGQVQLNLSSVVSDGLGGATEIPLLLNISGIDPSNPPNNFHLIRPDYPAWPNTNAVFGKEYLQAMAPFCAIRFMDWMGTNNSKVTNWASRPQPGIWGWKNQGTCYENMIALANTAGCDMWINVPLYATDDWATNMAQLVKQNLNPNLHCYYEVSNEMWNWGGAAFNPDWQQVETWDQSNSALTTTAAWARHGQEMAYLLMHFSTLMQPVLGSQGRPVFASQFGGTAYSSAGLQWIQDTYGAANNYVYGLACAPYIGTASTDPIPTDLTSTFTSMTDYLNSYIATGLQADIAIAKKFNVKYMCYESGQSLYPGTSQSAFTLYQSAQSDPRMGTIYTNLCNMLTNAGADLCCFYSFCGAESQYGYWGALRDIRQISNPTVKYAAEAAAASACNCGNAPASAPSNNSSAPSNSDPGNTAPSSNSNSNGSSSSSNGFGNSNGTGSSNSSGGTPVIITPHRSVN